jgi:dienelactone hydrolase
MDRVLACEASYTGSIPVERTIQMPGTQPLHTETLEYSEGADVFAGALAYEGTGPRRKPGVLVVRSAFPDIYARRRATQLARLGYVSLALDLCGRDAPPPSPEERAVLEERLLADRALLRRRTEAALKALRGHRLVDGRSLAAVGYSFGGAAVLEMARSGLDLCGVLSLHGPLAPGDAPTAAHIPSRVFILQGSEDLATPLKKLASFQEEMRKARADWQLLIYGGASGNFTDQESADYHEPAERRSWLALSAFLQDIFR